MTTYRVRATTHRAQVRVLGPTCDLSGPCALSGAHAPSIPICESPTMKQPPSMLFFPHQQAEKSPLQQHVVSNNPKSHHKTNTICPSTPFCPLTRKSPQTNAFCPLTPENTKTPALLSKRGGHARRRRDLNPRGAMHPYLLSREAHSTGLCDVSSADYFRAFLPRARTCARRDAHWRSARRRARDSNPRCHC